MKIRPGRCTEFSDMVNVKEISDLIVSLHEGDQRSGVFTQQLLQMIEIDIAPIIEVDVFNLCMRVELFRSMQHRVVLNPGGYNCGRGISLYCARQDTVDRLRPAGSKDYFPGCTVQQRCNRLSPRLDCRTCLAAMGMGGGRVSEILKKEGLHRLKHIRVQGRGCGIVKIDIHYWAIFSAIISLMSVIIFRARVSAFASRSASA